jgi:hypothetical protein
MHRPSLETLTLPNHTITTVPVANSLSLFYKPFYFKTDIGVMTLKNPDIWGDAVYCGTNSPKFRRNVLSPSSGSSQTKRKQMVNKSSTYPSKLKLD